MEYNEQSWERDNEALDRYITRQEQRFLDELYNDDFLAYSARAAAAGYDALERAMSPGGID